MKIVTAAEMREIDRVTSERYGIPSLQLMENAGTAVAQFAMRQWPEAKRITVICGKGNNGGDGLVAARKLHEAGREVRVILLAGPEELKGDAAANLSRLPVAARSVTTEDALREAFAEGCDSAHLLIDAILGAGFRPPIQDMAGVAIERINESDVPVLAVDIASGMSSDDLAFVPSIRIDADAIVTFTAPKPSHVFGVATTGPLAVAPIGSPEEAIVAGEELEVITADDVAPLIGPRWPYAHKGDFGHVLVIGGSTGKAGAAAMAGVAALRGGAGLVTVACPASVLPTVAGFQPELMTEPLAESEIGSISSREAGASFAQLAAGRDVLAIGPGAGRHDQTAEYIRHAVRHRTSPTVLDADGLNAFEGHLEELDGRGHALVLTPHPGEMARLTGLSVSHIEENRAEAARTLAQERHCYVVLKGHRTLIAAPTGPVWVNPTGNPGMATGGSGDILTGLVAAMIAQHVSDHSGLDVMACVCAGVYLHGLAGDVAVRKFGQHSLLATDLIAAFPYAFRLARWLSVDDFTWISGLHAYRPPQP